MTTTTLELAPIPGADEITETPQAEPLHPVVAIVKNAIDSGDGMDKLTTLYLKLRGGADDLKKQLALKMAPITTAMDMIEAHFLAKMNEMGVENLKNTAGTPYKTKAVSVTIADNSAFVDYVLDEALKSMPTLSDEARGKLKQLIVGADVFNLIETRASKTAVEVWLDSTGVLPPGLNRRTEFKVNVKAAAK